MAYPKYVFVTCGWYADHWWIPQNDIPCTESEMEEVLKYSLAMFAFPQSLDPSQVVGAGTVSFYTMFVTIKHSSLYFLLSESVSARIRSTFYSSKRLQWLIQLQSKC